MTKPRGVKIKGLQELRKRLNYRFKIVMNKTLRDKALRLEIGKIIAQDIRDNFDNGTTVLASPITRAFREFLEQYNSTHPDYRRARINITFTGELLDDLAKNVKADTTKLAFVVEHSNKKHKNYKSGGTFKGKKEQVTSKAGKTRNVTVRLTHKEITEHLIKKGYDYIKVSDDAEKIILKLIKNKILENIKREFGQ